MSLPHRATGPPAASEDAGPVAVVVYLSGRRRGTTERLHGQTLRVGRGPAMEIRPALASDSPVALHHATLHRAGSSYELEAMPGELVWVNGERVRSRLLESGDVLEIGPRGPVLRFRLYPPGSAAYKSVAEAYADCVECEPRQRRWLTWHAFVLIGRLLRELTTQTALWFRALVLVLLAALLLGTGLLLYQSLRLERQLAGEEERLGGIAEVLERAGTGAPSAEDLAALRAELERQLTATARRIERLEGRSEAAATVIAAAAPAVVLLQGAFAFQDPDTGRLLRFIGRPPLVSLEGEGPVVEVHFTGTAFVVAPGGVLMTNRHVARPWEEDESARAAAARGLEPVMRRFIGYLPGLPAPFEVQAVQVSDTADLAVLRCEDATRALPALPLGARAPRPGEEVIVLGYPTGIQALLARTDRSFLQGLQGKEDIDLWELTRRLAEAGHIWPLANSGIVGQVTSAAVVYDAPTTRGGSGGPVLNLQGEVIAVNSAVLTQFGGSNLGVPMAAVRELLALVGTDE